MTALIYRVVLGPPDVELATCFGNSVADWNERIGTTKNDHSDLDSHYRHVQAAGAELAVARFAEREWVTERGGGHEKPDVRPDIEVRWTLRENGNLPVYLDDVLARRFVLAVGEIPTFELVGWIVGTEALRIRDTVEGIWRDDVRGGWYVPRRFLRDVSELRAAVPA